MRTSLSIAMLWIVGHAWTPPAVAQEFRAGAAAVDISPTEFPMNMPGGFSKNPATSVHDPFFARTVVMNSGDTTVSMSVVDNLGADPSAIEEAKLLASKETEIAIDHMLVCSTHTHSGPSTSKNSGSLREANYRQLFIRGLADSIVQASAQLQPAEFGSEKHELPDEVFNRRWYLKPGKMPTNPFGELDQVKMNPGRSSAILDRPAAPTDPDITIISIQDRKHRPLALFANYSLHYVGAIPRGRMSADYFGEFARLMPTRMRADSKFVAMMSNGTSGDINNIPFGVVRPPREPFEQVKIVARKAADTAWFAHQKIEQHQSTVKLDMRERQLTLKYRRPSDVQIAYAEKVLAMPEKKALATMPRRAIDYARRTMAARDRQEDSVTVKLQAIRIGDFAVCAIPFETLVEIGLDLKSSSPFQRTMVIGLANGRYGYLPTPRQHRLGGYETWLGTNHVQLDASTIIVKNLKEMLRELKKD